MPHLALLIGTPDAQLHGVEGDLDRMAEALAAFGFTSERLYGPAATRAGILAALDALPARVQGGDAVVIYYSGHGGQIANPRAGQVGRGGPREPAFYRCLVPTDIRASTASDFRGVLSIELDARVAAIAERTANVAVILDCCHSEGIIRGDALEEGEALTVEAAREPGARAVVLGAPWRAPVEALRAALRAAGVDPDALAPEADPRVIRLVACGPREIATETHDARGAAGLFTAHLAATLMELRGRSTTWLALGRRVRQRVTAARGRQRPALKGPGDRLLFRVDEAPPRRLLGLVGDPARPRLGGGVMAGVEAGDRLLLAPLGETEAPIGAALVGRCGAASAELAVELDAGADRAPAVAIPLRYARPRARVRLRASPAVEALLRAALPASGVVAVAGDGAADDVVAELVEEGGALSIQTPLGAPLRAPLPLDGPPGGPLDAVLRHVGEVVEGLALARALAELRPPAALALDPARAAWTLAGGDARGRRRGLPPGSYTARDPLRLGAGSALVVTLQDALGLAEALYGWVFLICPSGQVRLLSQRHPWGAPVGADEPYVLGERLASADEGIEVRAAAALPRGGPTRGALLLIAADGQADLRSWERAAPIFQAVDPLRRLATARQRVLDDEGDRLPGHAGRFAVWRVPVDLGGEP